MKATVLVVEDEPAHVELLRRAVGGAFQVDVASTLADARARLESAAPPSLVLADLNLRDGKGYELLPGPMTPAPFPLVVLTSHGDEATAALAIKAGALEYIVKSPENFVDMPRIVERALRDWQLVVERRATEEALRESEERFHVLFSASPDVYVLHDPKGNVIDANRTAERLFGVTLPELRAKSVFDLGFVAPSIAAREATAAGGSRWAESVGPDILTLRPRGVDRSVVLEIRTTPFELATGVVVLAIARDVTREKEADESRRKLEEQLQQALKIEAMGRLAGGVAHDFNNILTGILGFTELIARRLDPADPLRDDVAEIRACAVQAASLTSQLLAFSRKQIIAPKTFDANDVLERNSRMLRRLISEDVDLEVLPAKSTSMVSMDPHQFEQVLVNLVVNARDAMPHGGRISISVDHRVLVDADCVARVDARPGHYVVLEVTDTGTGMTESVLAHIFEPFFTTKDDKGTGLGLPTSYGIVRQAGGFIDVSTSAGLGTTFRVFLPRVSAPEVEEAPVRQTVRPARGNEHILLVEDDERLRALVGRYLRQQGYTVSSARHAGDAILVAEDDSTTLDLLVSDVVLPTMNGPSLYARLRKIRPELRVLFVSGYSDSEALESARSAGELMAKPFTLEALGAKVRDLLDHLPDLIAP